MSIFPDLDDEVVSSEANPRATSSLTIDLTAGPPRPLSERLARPKSATKQATESLGTVSPVAGRWLLRYQQLLVVGDTAALIATLSAYRFAANRGPLTPRDVLAGTGLLAGWLVFLLVGRCYERRLLGLGSEEFRRVFEACARFGASVVISSWIWHPPVARADLLEALLLGLLLLLAGRGLARLSLRLFRRRGRCLHRVLAVGASEDIEHLVREAGRGSHYQVVGACLPDVGSGVRSLSTPAEALEVVGEPEAAVQAARLVGADIVAVTSFEVLGREGMRRLAWQLEGAGTRLLLVAPLTDVASPRITIRSLAGLSVLHVDEPRFSGARRALKDVFDRFIAFAAIVVLSPLLFVMALAVKATSAGPILYRQERVGRGGTTFSCLKFRSMHVDAEARLEELRAADDGNGVLFKLRHDPRVTSVGRIMRRYSVDELPQLFNVLLGTMSLVGPRPALPIEVDQYDGDVRRRLLVKPGITGLWQVSGRSDLSWAESIRLDLYYVENWSPALDLHILTQTVRAVATGRGAY